MKKNIFAVLGCLALMFSASCRNSQELKVAASNNLLTNATETPQIFQTIESSESKSNYPVSWVAVFSLDEFKDSTAELTVWNGNSSDYARLLDKKSVFYKAHGGVEIDLMNCSGYLAAGKIYVAEEPNEDAESPQWRLKIFRETVAKDVEEKIRKCAVPGDSNNFPANTDIFNQAFAVSPQDNHRKTIKINETVDIQKLFDSIPKNVKESVGSSANADNLKQSKTAFGLADDNWTDINGDGKVDLVLISGYKKSAILLLIGDQWKEIADVGD